MPSPESPKQPGYRSLTPNLVCRKAAEAIEFYKAMFGAEEIRRTPGPGGSIMHAELRIGDSILFVNDPMGKLPPALPEAGQSNPAYLHVYVADVDDVVQRALAAGARTDMPVQDMFWGDRYGKITDPFGQQWGIATHKEDVAPEEVQRRMKELLAKAAG